MRHPELLAALAGQVGPAFAAVKPPLGYELLGVVEGDRVTVACHKVHDDKLFLKC